MTALARDDVELFPIRTVASLTGVHPVTLRAWERRYGLVRPVRTAGGQRAYTRADIDAIHRILAQLERGMTIGQVHLGEPVRAAAQRRVRRPVDAWQTLRDRMSAAIAQFDEDRLEDAYGDALALHPWDVVTARVLRPLLLELGERWVDSPGGIAEEHFFGVYLRNKLGARFHHRARRTSGPRVAAACLPGDYHETGLLLFALAAHEQGMRIVLLGGDMPLTEITHTVHRARCRAIVLGATIEPRPEVLAQELPALVAAAGVPVFVGGPRAVPDRDAIIAAGAEPLGEQLDRSLKRLAASLGDRRSR